MGRIKIISRKERKLCLDGLIRWVFLLLGLLFFLAQMVNAQPTTSTISPRAFGAKSWRENGLAPASLPLTGNTLWDVRLASDGVIYYWDGDSWEPISGSGGGGVDTDDQTASEVPIDDVGLFYLGTSVESALQEIGSDSRWTDARQPLAHGSSHSSGGSDPLTLTGYESVLESILDLPDLQGSVTDAQVPDAITISNATTNRCARFDSSGVLVPSGGDCPSGDTDTTGTGTIGGTSGATDNAVIRADGTGGATIQSSLVSITDGGVVQVLRSGAGQVIQFGGTTGNHAGLYLHSPGAGDWSLDVNSASDSAMGRLGTGMIYIKESHGASPEAQLDTGLGGLLRLSSTGCVWWTSSSNSSGTDDTHICRSSPAVIQIDDSLRMRPRTSPPVTCGAANTLGVEYTDDSGAKCWCDGSAWVKVAGGGTCA